MICAIIFSWFQSVSPIENADQVAYDAIAQGYREYHVLTPVLRPITLQPSCVQSFFVTMHIKIALDEAKILIFLLIFSFLRLFFWKSETLGRLKICKLEKLQNSKRSKMSRIVIKDQSFFILVSSLTFSQPKMHQRLSQFLHALSWIYLPQCK